MDRPKIYKLIFSEVYPMYIDKVARKGFTKEDVDTVIYWLTGYDEQGLQTQIDSNVDFEQFFIHAPKMNPNRHLITGSICGVKVQEIEDPITQDARYLDKLVDEIAKGKAMEKILRTPK